VKTRSAIVADARGLRIAIVSSRFNATIVDGLLEGARSALQEMGGRAADWEDLEVPGAFELPLAAQAAAASRRFDAVVALGAVIKGETDHYEHIAREAASGLAAVARETGVPVGFGLLTVVKEAQALARSAAGPDNKGAEAARAAVAMVHVLRRLAGKERKVRRRRIQGGGR
jgi:6,7-dimethyl-8-ribityllumazine synthase